MKQHYGHIAALLAVITALSLGATALCGVRVPTNRENTLSVTASFYPVYTAALQVVGDTPEVEVRCLTQPATGCLHDYQLSPAERSLLEETDILILNGVGAEAFLESTLASLPALRTVDTSAGLVLEQEHGHEHEGHAHAHNEHIWMNPVYYACQVEAIRDELCAADPSHAAAYRSNAAQYIQKIKQSAALLSEAAGALCMEAALVFHDSMTYVAHTLGWDVLATLPLGEDSGISASAAAAAADAVRGKETVLLYDNQYAVQMTDLAQYAARSAVVVLDSAVKPRAGVADSEAWLHAMAANTQALKEAAK